ncbi:methyltransferase domain-containing protein [Limibaculum sp. FT325]|uniref:class I SAM-dependent methyltransferase n=1 Tax=Thermohalobaculum sediminis TaxID=2939436 RepID=UPI0020C01F8A|nr:class I SAM-dependent methyltransferase [Limibaculum sediminis]MCL5778964.1 methyltransferase domain-containing protein [Limibaculum sediminis]
MPTCDAELSVPADSAGSVRTHSEPRCHVCDSVGDILYSGLRDRLFGAPGEWTLRRCQNAGCGLLWLDPMPVVEDLPKLYQTYYTHSTGDQPTLTGSVREAMKRAYWRATYGPNGSRLPAMLLTLAPGFRAQLALQVFDLQHVEGGRLLDVGCGSGAALERMARLGWECEGIDFDEKAVDAGRARGLTIQVGSLEHQRYPDQSFDAVVMNHVLEHVPDPRLLIRECYRILKPEGQFVCITPNAASWCHSLFGTDWRGLEPPRHLHIFTQSSALRLMREIGWDNVEARSSIANSHGIGLASWNLKRYSRLDMLPKRNVWQSILARLFQISASLRLSIISTTGEEILLRAKR